MSKVQRYWVMDYETIVNCFTAVFESLSTNEVKVFVIHDLRNDLTDLLKFFDENVDNDAWHFGFNNLNFDSQITEFIIDSSEYFRTLEANEVAGQIYKYAQWVINRSKEERADYPEFKLRIKSLDIYRLNNWDSVAKMASLKWIQGSIGWFNVQDMPHDHTERVEDYNTLMEVINYCINDVASTKAIFNLTNGKGDKTMHSEIKMRKELSDTYKISLHSAPEPKISKEIFLHYLSDTLGMQKSKIRKLRTYREQVNLRDVILPIVKFNTHEFNSVLHWFSAQEIKIDVEKLKKGEKLPKRAKLEHIMYQKGVKTVYALGGLHGCIRPGVYKKGNGKIIVSADVVSYYPNLAIRNNWSPAHIPNKDFCELYEGFFDKRRTYPKGTTMNYLFKIVLNSTFGLSNSAYSFLYDPEFLYRITVNGQLLLSMLYEMVMQAVPGAQPLMQNTDGLEFIIDENYRDIYLGVCKQWEELTNLELEFDEYKSMIIRDVNNYMAVYENDKIKYKGVFEYEGRPLHKDSSGIIVKKALKAYFIDGILPKDFLANNRNILDYCLVNKLRKPWKLKKVTVIDGVYDEEKTQKTVRYLITNKGAKLLKYHPDGREQQLVSGQCLTTLFNIYEKKEWKEYDINDQYYLEQIYKIIDLIESDNNVTNNIKFQLTLF